MPFVFQELLELVSSYKYLWSYIPMGRSIGYVVLLRIFKAGFDYDNLTNL